MTTPNLFNEWMIGGSFLEMDEIALFLHGLNSNSNGRLFATLARF
jgi:hypothetical protein